MFARSFQSTQPFSIRLADEIMRSELDAHFGRNLRVLQYMRILSEQPSGLERGDPTYTAKELEGMCRGRHRYVEIKALVGPVDAELGHTAEVAVVCRLFTDSAGHWYPHFIALAVMGAKQSTPVVRLRRVYEEGWMSNSSSASVVHKNAENPCLEMCSLQKHKGGEAK